MGGERRDGEVSGRIAQKRKGRLFFGYVRLGANKTTANGSEEGKIGIAHSGNLPVVEKALRPTLHEDESSHWLDRAARDGCERAIRPHRNVEMAYPACWWRGRDGIDQDAVRAYFPALGL